MPIGRWRTLPLGRTCRHRGGTGPGRRQAAVFYARWWPRIGITRTGVCSLRLDSSHAESSQPVAGPGLWERRDLVRVDSDRPQTLQKLGTGQVSPRGACAAGRNCSGLPITMLLGRTMATFLIFLVFARSANLAVLNFILDPRA